ncbi:odorant receptor 4-like isoform X2 [Temnothorax longispinosus]|uniref:odorant receptor 4-like isoform X2 n=2 Tax=Temnothorax longispinosus TaxID=300112 RepID=UPI003A9979E3
MTRKSTINRTLKLMLTLCGIWPGTSCIMICRTYWIIALATDEICHYRYLLMHLHSNDLFDLMDCFSSFLTQVKFSIKLIIFWLNERKFIEILTMMAEDWNDCAGSDINMRETVELPVDINTKRMYKTLLGMQFVHLIMSGCGTGLLNALLLTLTLHVGGQMDILRCWLTELVPRGSEERSESVAVATTKIIRKHQRIINFSEYIEDLYTYIALVQFTLNTVLICSLGFLIVTAIGSPDATEHIVRSLLFYTVTNLEAFIFCYAGEYLKNKSKAIGNAAYNSTWYEMKPKNSRNLIFVILRAQKQLTLTVGKIMDLSLESFTSIMKASGSYLSVLLAMQ